MQDSQENSRLFKFNWYPGHIAKAERELREKLRQVDLVVELKDARIPITSRHKELAEWAENKPIISVFSKLDLADPKRHLDGIKLNIKTKQGLKSLADQIDQLAEPLHQRYKNKGIVGRPLKIMVVGYPNVGKSSLINALAGKKKARVENKPGVTRQQQWVDLESKFRIKLLDTPGIIPTKFTSDTEALKLALVSCIADTAFDPTEIAREAMLLIEQIYPGKLQDVYKLQELTLEKLSETKNNDLTKAAIAFIQDFRNLKIGRLSLE